MILLDSHAHLDTNMDAVEVAETVARAREAGVCAIINIGGGDGLEYAQNAVRVAEQYPDVFATVAVHPHDARGVGESEMAVLRELCAHPKVVAVGETGLDYHYNHSPRDVQIEVFRGFIRLALEQKLPLSLHVRDGADPSQPEQAAHRDCVRILKEEGASAVGGVVHCFTAGPEELGPYLDLGFHISIPGVVTFRNAEGLRQAVPLIPDERLLVETDSPYLAPVPKRGRKNEPAFVQYTVQRVAELRDSAPEKIGILTAQNAISLFHLPESLLA